ncbi:hypothetical protein MRB53_019927 [Persea americana]|uniref:Uncharacterized protein n=1 Tax=Persea americana TaxID=3435 RepID=A0ACC2KZX6_PERAE|nr:hypothetical protein MRB53_019927 [Persea americana]|eukprot:TRINITY_DN10521_c3_g1_i1.p1 TRINITY_DN10521_c3_g1~~TRINITY_DN10521_c3_g1_i1.p1  ORF type:complete len:120 (+),score=14.94 TRINITY_DN10521_c3_g1_i1:190-549(+)
MLPLPPQAVDSLDCVICGDVPFYFSGLFLLQGGWGRGVTGLWVRAGISIAKLLKRILLLPLPPQVVDSLNLYCLWRCTFLLLRLVSTGRRMGAEVLLVYDSKPEFLLQSSSRGYSNVSV